MEIWLDTIKSETVLRAHATGLLTGITTNPSIVSSATVPLKKLLHHFLEIQKGPVAAQVVEETVEQMENEAQVLTALSKRVLVKIPCNEVGFKCMHRLQTKQIPFLATAVFTPLQALAALKLGAHYIAPYIGRIQDQGENPWHVLERILKAKQRYGYSGKIMAAGVRTVQDVESCLDVGVCAVTVRASIFEELMQEHPGVTHALKTFKTDWEKYALR